MNLHGIAKGAVGAINPHVPVTIQHSTGVTVQPDGSTVPSYSTVNTTGQIQALTGGDVLHVNNLGLQKIVAKAYLDGDVEGLVRSTGQGGDLLTIGASTYRVSAVLERWPDWCCVALTEQL
jgi:hypothetical protein